MQTRVFTLGPDESLERALALFREKHVGGAPVIDREGRLVGVISVFDLLASLGGPEPDAGCALFFRDHPLSWTTEWSFRLEGRPDALRGQHVSDVMTREVVAVAPDTSLADVARVLREHRIHRVVVCDVERMLGIVSSFDLLACFETETS